MVALYAFPTLQEKGIWDLMSLTIDKYLTTRTVQERPHAHKAAGKRVGYYFS